MNANAKPETLKVFRHEFHELAQIHFRFLLSQFPLSAFCFGFVRPSVVELRL